MKEGKKHEGKTLPVGAKKYVEEGLKLVIVYAGQYFGTFGSQKFILLYMSCGAEVKQHLYLILNKI